MKTTEPKILEAYSNADRVARDRMWIRFIALRDRFDDIEHYGTAVDTESTVLCNQDATDFALPRVRHVERLSRAAPRYSIIARVVQAEHCNAGHKPGQELVLDVDGNFITSLCPKKMCVYLVSQLDRPVALINERLSEGHEPNDFHFMRFVRCPDVGVGCLGYGQVMIEVQVVARLQKTIVNHTNTGGQRQ